jgi:C-terminal peptidase prc
MYSYINIKKTRKNIFIALLLRTVFLIPGCADLVKSDHTDSEDTDDEYNEADDLQVSAELSYNHLLLYSFYLYAEEELRTVGYYKDLGDGSPYGDVIAMYQSMSDPYTNYWTPEKAQPVLNSLTTSGNLPLIGVELAVQKDETGADRVIIKRVYEDTPAQKAGLLKGDFIYKVDGVEVTGENVLEKFQGMIAGGENVPVNLTVLRNGNEIVIPTMYKKTMLLPTVFLDYLYDIPVIQLTGFTSTTTDKVNGTAGEFRAILKKIDEEGKSAAGIIDLRGNPGGSVDQCFAIIEELVAEGVYIIYEDHYYSNALQAPVIAIVPEKASSGGLGEHTQWVFLADENSASAAEILLYAAISCLDTKVFGAQTFGKGIGQYYIQTPESALAAVSALQFYDKNMKTYHGIGIIPDVKEDDPERALERAAAYAVSLTGRRAESARFSPADIKALNARLVERREKAASGGSAPGGSWRLIDF